MELISVVGGLSSVLKRVIVDASDVKTMSQARRRRLLYTPSRVNNIIAVIMNSFLTCLPLSY